MPVRLSSGPIYGSESSASAADRLLGLEGGQGKRMSTHRQIHEDDTTVRSGRWLDRAF